MQPMLDDRFNSKLASKRYIYPVRMRCGFQKTNPSDQEYDALFNNSR